MRMTNGSLRVAVPIALRGRMSVPIALRAVSVSAGVPVAVVIVPTAVAVVPVAFEEPRAGVGVDPAQRRDELFLRLLENAFGECAGAVGAGVRKECGDAGFVEPPELVDRADAAEHQTRQSHRQ